MVDAGIKKVTVKSAELPYVQFTTTYNSGAARQEIDQLYYNFRYRIISEDKNRFSHWSSTEKIVMPDVSSGKNNANTQAFPYTGAPYISTIKDANNAVTTIWNKKTDAESSDFEKIFNKIGVYDIWIRWNANSTTSQADAGWTAWEYRALISTNSYSIINPIPTGVGSYKAFDIAVQVPTTIKIRDFNDTKLTLYRRATVL